MTSASISPADTADTGAGSPADAETGSDDGVLFQLHEARLIEIAPLTVYEIMRLRTDVFVVEQGITAEPELDGRDAEPDTMLIWAQDAPGRVVSTLRVLGLGTPLAHIGRVATSADARGRGIAGDLVRHAVEVIRRHDVSAVIEMHAQAHLEAWYTHLGFHRVGDPFDEAGIPHVLMRW